MPLLTDGYQCLIAFQAIDAGILLANLPAFGISVVFREKTVKPPELEAGRIDVTTMRSIQFRQTQPKRLISNGTMNCEVQYDPAIYALVSGVSRSVLNQNGVIVVRMPDGTFLEMWGFIEKFMGQPLKEGEFAGAELDVVVSNQDASQQNAPVKWWPDANSLSYGYNPTFPALPYTV